MYNGVPNTPINVVAVPPPTPTSIDVDDVQGDVLVGLQKNSQTFMFFQINDVATFKTVLRADIARRLTMTRLVVAREFQVRDAKFRSGPVAAGKPAPLPLVGVNVGFTSAGIKKLVPDANLGDASFAAGASTQAKGLGDPVDGNGNLTTWLAPYTSGAIDGVLSVTGGDDDAVANEVTVIHGLLDPVVTFGPIEQGAVRPGEFRGHEHFGFSDGISQPAPSALGLIPFPGQQEVAAGFFVFGYDQSPATATRWMKNGSFMVFRRLKQLVPEFAAALQSAAGSLGTDADLLGARMMGRWKSGAPATLTPLQDDPAFGADATKNNDFDFSGDQVQRKCPYGAHIRKMNPRVDLTGKQADISPRRILRAGIPFGPELTDAESTSGSTTSERGLLFVCYQTSIANQFEFLQASWANNTGFVPGKTRPDETKAAVTVGFDPIIGQNGAGPARTRFTDEAVPNFPVGNTRTTFDQATDVVVPEGGVYLFVPSLTAIVTVLST